MRGLQDFSYHFSRNSRITSSGERFRYISVVVSRSCPKRRWSGERASPPADNRRQPWGFPAGFRDAQVPRPYDRHEPSIILLLGGFCMARGRITSLTVCLTPAERQLLLARQRAIT